MKKIVIAGVLLCLSATMAFAGGLNFNWNTSGQCPATSLQASAKSLTWDCVGDIPNGIDPNAGDFFMVASVIPNVAMPGFIAMDSRIDGQSVGPIPAWWQSYNAGSCRETAFLPGVPPTTPAAPCAGTSTTKLWSAGAPLGGLGLWAINGNRFYMVIGFATAAGRANPLVITTQYNAYNVEMLTTNSADDPANSVVACAGCASGMTLVLNQINLNGDTGQDAVTGTAAVANASQCITWQGGSGPSSCGETPARNTTWGQVKSLYR